MKDIASLDPFLEARLIKAQEKAASRVVLEDRFSEESIAGVDQAFFQDMVISACEGSSRSLNLLFVDGCGINHPRSVGLASFVGTVLDMPTIGISKNALCGCFDRPEAAGEAKLLKYDGKDVGFVLKSKVDCRPIFVAPGHRITLESACWSRADA
jgi:deoxyinosine 3'endonuclease (endonuclease V)